MNDFNSIFTPEGVVTETCRHGRLLPVCPFCTPRPVTPPFVHHSETSADAAFAIKDKAPSIRERVYELLKHEALTDQQIAKRLDLDPNTARPRRIELTNKNRVVEVGKALTEAGRHASVWKAA